MSRRLNVMFIHEATGRNGEVFKNWYNCGVAHENEKGTITIRLRMLPAVPSGEGEYVFLLQEPKSNGPSGGNGEGLGF